MQSASLLHNQQDQKQQCEPEQSQEEQEQEVQDWDSLLGVVLVTASQDEQQKLDSKAAGGPPSTACTLHRVTRKQLGAARSCIRHLSLARYAKGRELAQCAAAEVVAPSAALAAAAGVPPIPWGLLAATPSLTSLHITASQAQHLAAGSPTAAVQAAVASTAAGEAEAGGSQTAVDVWAATLGRLCCLRVTDIHDGSHLVHLGRLLGAATGLTQLVLTLKAPVCKLDASVTCTPLLEGLRTTQAVSAMTTEAGAEGAAAAAAAAAASGGGDAGGAAQSTTAAAAGSSGPLCHLPALRHLELPGRFAPLLEFWLRQPAAAAAAQLTYLDLDCMSARDADLGCLAACSGLRELVVQDGDATRPLHLPGGLSRLTTVTRLGIMWWAQPELPHVVWRLTQLRHLSLQRSNVPGYHLPSDISRLRQLQQLDLGNTNVQELPQELGAWLPQLEGLDIGGTYVGELPQGLTSLTCLTRLEAAYSNMVQVQSLTGLVGLNVLDLTACQLRPPLQPLNHLSTLHTLHLQLALDLSAGEVETVAIPGPLPALRSFTLGGDAPLRVGQLQVVAGAQQLTQLTLRDCLDADQFARLGQLGVLPRLRRLCLGGHGQPSWAAALPWVTQQPHLVSLMLVGCTVEGPDLQQLPPQLEDLCLDKCALSAAQPAELTQLSQLRTLSMMHMGLQRLPPWLASLQRLEVLWLHSLHCTADFNTWRQPCPVQQGWEVLVQLPLLRQVCAPNDDMEPRILQHVPHLCWH